MIKLHRLSLFTTICFIALFICTSHVYALFDSNVKKAKEFMQAGMYPQAIALLEKEIIEEPTNEEAHFQLGICYINQDNYSGADERFASAVKLQPDYGYKIGKEFKNASDEALKKGSLSHASSHFDKAIIYDPSYKKQGYHFYMSLGDSAQSVHYYDRALQYSNGDKDKKKRVGLKFLKFAAQEWPGSRGKALKQKALGLVGEKIVQEVLPEPYMKTTFEKSYTYADAVEKKYGQIRTFQMGKDDVKIGDKIIVIAKVLGADEFNGKEVKVILGGKWVTTTNGYFSTSIETLQNDKYYYVSLNKRKDVEVTVSVKRYTVPGPNLDLLYSYLKE